MPAMRVLDSGTTVSLIIPCYNEVEVLPALFDRVRAAVAGWGTEIEVLLVDDGSTDATWRWIRKFHRRDPRWKGLRLSRNFGQQAAIWAGLRQARGQVAAILDADLQDPPEELGRFLRAWADGYDVVYAVRQNRQENLFRRLAYSGFYRLLSWLAETRIPLDSGDFGVMDRRVVRAILRSREQRPFLRGLRAWAGFRQLGLGYSRPGRAAGISHYSIRSLLALALDGLTGFSLRPLRLAAGLGAMLLAAGILFGLAILALAGAQLLSTGFLGEYIGRGLENSRRRPVALVRSRLGIRRKPGFPSSRRPGRRLESSSDPA